MVPKKTFQSNISHLPDGSFISVNDGTYLLHKNQLHLWTPFGYEKNKLKAENRMVTVLTPHSIVKMFSDGYVPQISI